MGGKYGLLSAHLHVHSCYSFLDGASSPRQIIEQASQLGLKAIALTDHDNVAGAVEFYNLALQAGMKPIQGAELTVASLAGRQDSPDQAFHLVVLAENPTGYANLCRIITDARTRSAPGRRNLQPLVTEDMLQGRTEGLIALSGCRRGEVPYRLLRGDYRGAEAVARRLCRLFGRHNFYLELQADYLPGTRLLRRAMEHLAEYIGVELVATNNVHYHDRERFWIHDLLTCVRLGLKIDDVHPERRLNAENYLKAPEQMHEAFADLPAALKGTEAVAERCSPAFNLTESLHPIFPLPQGISSQSLLRRLVYRGASERYGRITEKIRRRLDHELSIIQRLGYTDYFLLVWDVVNYARSAGIRCAGRGSAADSAVAYCLYITEIDAIERGLLFERFMSLERAESPDIDIDFDWRYRDQVAKYVYEKYGSDHVAAVCTYHTFRGRSAIRDFGKVLQFPAAEIDRLAKRWYGAVDENALDRFVTVPELRDSGIPPHRYRQLLKACAAVRGFPRHMGTHSSGLVISRHPLVDITPLQLSAKGTIVCQFDKRGVEDLGLVKLDLLPLRTLGAVDDASVIIRRRNPDFDYDRIPLDDPATYCMISQGDTIGVFQLESPAQRALHPQLRAKNLEDIVASVAIIRPGPIKGNMVEPFLKRRRGEEAITYLHPKLKPILEKTWGVVLFQEQVIEIATAIAGFTPGEADRLRRVMTHARSHDDMQEIGQQFIEKARRCGVDDTVAQAVFSYIQGYASYGFCEAHAAAFAVTAYKTAYLLRHYPAEFFAAVLGHQPMGYYPANTIALEARRRGAPILPVDINKSDVTFTVEYDRFPTGAIRIGLSQVQGLPADVPARIVAERQRGMFRSLTDFVKRMRKQVGRDAVERLILAGAFDAVESNRRRCLWKLGRLWRETGAGTTLDSLLLQPAESGPNEDFSEFERWLQEYRLLGISVHRYHLMEIFRSDLREQGILDTRSARKAPHNSWIRTAGVVICPHRPPTRSGRIIVYFMLEDEFGLVDVTVFEEVYREQGALLFGETQGPLIVEGYVRRRRGSFSIIAERLTPYAGTPLRFEEIEQ